MKPTGRPLILTAETEHLPIWVRVRDLILTVLLWLSCGKMWLELFPEIKSWNAAKASEELTYELPTILVLLEHGVLLIGGLLVTYFFWGLYTFRRANRDLDLPVPPHLPPEEEARAYGIKPEEIPALRELASVTVLAGKDGQIVSWQPGFAPKQKE
jgi:poly-beta-1,6-N-acetyl-D-glucosamine biosynthesis protein PgaD